MANDVHIEVHDGAAPSLSLVTGTNHRIVIRHLFLVIERLYHDDRPVQTAPFTVELANGKMVEGHLDARGKARVRLSAPPKQVQFGPDSRPWTRADRRENPDYCETLSAADIESLIDAHFAAT